MNRVFPLIGLLIALSFAANAQVKESGCIIEQTTPGANDMIWENDSLKFSFVPTSYFWTVRIENKTSDKIICDWDNVLFIYDKTTSGIVFDDTIELKKNDPKGTSTIVPNTILRKDIFPIESWGEYGLSPVFLRQLIKKWGEDKISIIIPIQFGQNIQEYEFTFRVYIPEKKRK